MNAPLDSTLLNFVIRMVVPMRREFGRSLDVQQFMRDQSYARTVLDQALASNDQRLREYAEHVSRHLSGLGGATPAKPAAAGTSPAAPGTPAAPVIEPASATPAPAPMDATEAELRAKMMRKYTTGLR